MQLRTRRSSGRLRPVSYLCVMLLISAAFPALAESFIWGMDFRYRLELVDEQGFDENAYASTLRTRLHLQSPRRSGFQFFVEGANVLALGLDDYNAGFGSTPDRIRFPVIADPEDTRLNQAWIDWQWYESINLRAGRQRIKLDNDRFVGNVGWRQNEQTYDAISMTGRFGQLATFYAYVDQVNRIFDQDTVAGRHRHASHFLRGGIELAEGHQLASYFYAIDDRDAAALSNRTLGIRYQGKTVLNGMRRLNWLIEWAHQNEYGDNPIDYSAHYLHARIDFDSGTGWRPRLGFEQLSGSRQAGSAFRTPLATLHAFNGWADRFLTTPSSGLNDWYGGFRGSMDRIDWQVLGHWFQNEANRSRLGHELDASVNFRLHTRVSLLVKAARFTGSQDRVPSATKVWLQLTFELP